MIETDIKNELKNCPFCGGDGIVFHYKNTHFQVECVNCESSTAVYKNEKEAINLWNKRTT
jgi:Lar family restriction alleviation protein